MTLDNFSGSIITAESAEYETVRSVYGGEGSPAVIVRPLSAADVAVAVRHAASEGMALAVRSGGHSPNGTNTGGLVIDLSALNAIEVLDGGRVRIGGGAVWGDVAATLGEHGLALTSGDTSSVGVGGLTLGGGVGWMVRQYGLALDSLIEAEVVTAAGDVVTASELVNRDLFWALRGGGGNFGVVTHFTFQAHDLDGVLFGTVQFDGSDVATTLKLWRDVMRSAPERLNTTFLAMPEFGPDMRAATQLLVLWAGTDAAEAAAAIQPLIDLPGVTGHTLEPKAYADVLDEAHPPEGPIVMVDNNAFSPEFTDELIDSLVEAHSQFGAAVLMIRSLSGALNRVPSDATAFAARDSEVLIISAAFLSPDAGDAGVKRIRDLWAGIDSNFTTSYGNFIPRSGPEITQTIYPPATLVRLREVKNTWDPSNLFRLNHNFSA